MLSNFTCNSEVTLRHSFLKIIFVIRCGYAHIALDRAALDDPKTQLQAWVELVKDDSKKTKTLHAFAHKKEASNTNNALLSIELDMNDYNVTEYYYPNVESLLKRLNINKKCSETEDLDVYFIVHDKYYFRCESCRVRNDWISAIVSKSHYVNEIDRRNCKPYNGASISNVKYSYRLYDNYNKNSADEKKNDGDQGSNLMGWLLSSVKFCVDIRFVPLNRARDKHYNIKLSFADKENYKKTTLSIFCKIALNILAQQLYPKQTKQDWCKLVYSGGTLPCGNLRDFINNNVKNLIDSYGQGKSVSNVIIEYDTTYYHGFSLNDSCFVGKFDATCKDGINCLIYLNMKHNYMFTKENYEHMVNFNHFKQDLSDKPVCKYGDKCYSFDRMSQQ